MIRNFPCLLFCLFLILLSACENDLTEVNRLFSKTETRIEKATGVELLYSDSAILQMRIEAPVLVRHLDPREPFQEFPEGFIAEFFTEDGNNIAGRLTAKYARRLEETNEFLVRDSVVYSSTGGERLETEELTWYQEKDKVFTNKFVVLRRPGEIIYGHGFESNVKFTEWRIRAIEGRIRSNEITKDLKN